MYISGSQSPTKIFRLTGTRLAGPLSQTPESFDFTGGDPVISSNGGGAGTGILWLIDSAGNLRAYDATNLNNELYSSPIDGAVKFSIPIVSNGKVFVPTVDSLEIFGLLPNNSAVIPNSMGVGNIPLPGILAGKLLSDNRSWRQVHAV